jgi:SAM-dependent methyltransferase
MTNASLTDWETAQSHEQEFWESYADTYVRYPQILLEHLAGLSDAGEFIRDELRSAALEDVLEVGVGPLGIGILGMRAGNFHITGIDPLARMDFSLADPALETYVQELRRNVTYERSRGEAMAFHENRFDFVCCHNVIDHAQHPLVILKEIFRILKAGRLLYLTLNTFSHIGRLKFETLRRFAPAKTIFASHPHSFVHSGVLKALIDTGYNVIRHEGGDKELLGPARLSKFLCRKPVSP